MPAPTNISFATATDLGTVLPTTVTQTVDFAGTTYEVYYTYTAQPADGELGVWAFGDLVTYQPTLHLYHGPVGAPVFLIDSLTNRPIQFPFVPGTQYFFKITPNAGNPTPAVLTLNVQRAPNDATIPAGSIVIPDDTTGFPAAVLSSTTGVNTKFILGFPSTESADVLSTSGRVLVYDTVAPAASQLKVYAPDFQTVIATLNGAFTGADPAGCLRACQGTQSWFVGKSTGGASTVKKVTSAGAFGPTTWTPSGTIALAAANDESILYYSGAIGTALKQWNLTTNMAAADLHVGFANQKISDLLVLTDDTIVALYNNTTGGTAIIRQYDNTGTLLQTWTVDPALASVDPRMEYALDDPVSVWTFSNHTDGTSTVRNTRLSDGVAVHSFTVNIFEDGAFQAAQTAAPARFGTAFSCPLLITRVQITQGVTNVAFTVTPRVIRRLRRAPHIAQLGQRIYINRFLLDMQTGVGANDVPTTPGHDPTVMLRVSRNGGQTFSDEIEMSAGELGHYFKRVYVWRLGQARDWIFEISVSDPVAWSLMAAVLDLDVATN